MSSTFGKLAPTAIVGAMIVWCCWGYLEPGPGGMVARGPELPRIAPELYAPPDEPVSPRDPFRPVLAKKPVPAEKPKGTQKKAQPKPDPRQLAKSGEESPIPSVVAVHVSPRDILGRFTLEATYIRGDRRVAIINGQVFRQGQTMPISRVSKDLCTITEIGRYKVVLRHRGRNMELTYQNPPLGTDPLAKTQAVGSENNPIIVRPPGTP